MTLLLQPKALASLALSLTFLALAACSSGPAVQPGMAVSQPAAELGQSGFSQSDMARHYLIRPVDVISVTVFREPDLSLETVTVSPMGQISLPLLGNVDVAGKSAADIEAELERALDERFLREPEVVVNVLEYASHLVTVEGAVTEPGVFTFTPGTRLSGGISLAQGPVRVADSSQVAVFRQTDEGLQIARFDYAAVRAGLMLDPVLQPGDRIVVGLDGLSQFWQDILKAVPAFALFTNANI